jgi:hypothetical protein
VIDEALAPEEGIDPAIIAALAAEGYPDKYASNTSESCGRRPRIKPAR